MHDVECLVGRDDAVSLIRDLSDRPLVTGRPTSQQRPLLVLEGARGAGKSALIGVLDTWLDQNVPHATLDLEASKPDGLPDILSALAFQLSRSCPRYGSIRFGRFTLAQLVMATTVDQDNLQRARAQIEALLRQQRGTDGMRKILLDTSGDLIDAVAIPLVPTGLLKRVTGLLVALLFGGLQRWEPGRRITLGAYFGWFGHRGRALKNDAIDELVALNRQASSQPTADLRRTINELLWDALLTDLREHFANSRQSRDLLFACVVLVDNADTALGQEFISTLIQARRDRPDQPDPLTVVVTSRGDLLVNAPGGELTEFAPGDSADPQPHRWTGRFRLRDLSVTDTRRMVMELGLRGSSNRSTAVLHRFTDGHPASTRTLVRTLGRYPEDRDSLPTLLGRPEPGLGSDLTRVDERLQQDLLGDWAGEHLPDLMLCAAALEESHARAGIDLLAAGDASYQLIRPRLFPRAGGAGPKVLRRLLLRQLAEDPQRWEAAFRHHRQARAVAGDEPGELYYALAQPDLLFVAQRMAHLLETMTCSAWLERLQQICRAPHRAPGPGITAHQEMQTLLRTLPVAPAATPLSRYPQVARVVVATWIAEDPLTVTERSGLYLKLAADYQEIARSCGQDDIDPLLRAAHQCQQQAER